MRADLGVDGEGEVDRRRSLGELNDVTGRREDEDLVLIEIELEELEKLVRRFRVHLELDHLPEPGQVTIQLVGALGVLLVAPMRRNAVIRRAMHFARADLNLVELPSRPKDGRVQR